MRVYGSLAVLAVVLGLGGCGGGGDGSIASSPVVTQILSDPAYDGDIQQTIDSTGGASYVVTQGMSSNVQTVLAGIDPVTGDEFRAFLDFPLDGPGGVPIDAFIDSAYLEVFVDGLDPPNGSVPIRVDLVSFPPSDLLASNFDRGALPALASVLVQGDINSADVGTHVSVDVTPLMIQAQRLKLVDFQVRVMEDLGPAIETLVHIDDSTATPSDRRQHAPLLTVTYH